MQDGNKGKYPEVVIPECQSKKALAGQKALVTGASSGIGKAVAGALGEAGADVVVNYRGGEDQAREVVEEILSTGSRAYAHPADVSNEDQVRTMFQKMFSEFGTIDILINNAGLQKDAPFEEMTLEEWNLVIQVNLTGQFLCARETVREFKRRGVVKEISSSAGKIICMSSVHEIIPWAGHVNYAASKGGVMLMMKSIAQEVAPYRIRVNSIAPGAIRTPINTVAWQTPEAMEQTMTQSSPIACEEFLLDLEKTFSISLNHIKTMISDTLKKLYGGNVGKITLVHSRDGSGKGAAIMAAVAASAIDQQKN